MTDPRTIHDYLDGALDPESESGLFSALASDPEARQELNEQIRLHLAVKKDLAAIAVPADATSAIFGALGYAVPGAAPVVVASTPWWRKGAWLLLLLLLSVGTGFMLRMLWPRTEYVSVPSVMPVAPSSTASSTPSTPVPPTLTQPTRTQHRTSASTAASMPPADVVQAPMPSSSTQAFAVHAVAARPIVDAQPLTRVAPADAPTSVWPRLGEAASMTMLERSAFSIVAHGRTNLAMDPVATSTMDGDAALEQMHVGVSYDLDDRNAIALLGGRQRIAQEFTRTENGRDVVYRQLPSLWWGGLSYTHAFKGLGVDDVFTPYAQATLGWMQTGPMARGGVGITLAPQQRWSVSVGIDATAIVYPIQSRYFTSSSWSVSYGLSYRF